MVVNFHANLIENIRYVVHLNNLNYKKNHLSICHIIKPILKINIKLKKKLNGTIKHFISLIRDAQGLHSQNSTLR